jgi:glycosyltransferase involved in cell wall biosynthesis
VNRPTGAPPWGSPDPSGPVPSGPVPSGRAPRLSIVFPCLDEAERLPATLAAYLAHYPPGQGGASEVELVVVDDGSTDGTAAVAEAVAATDQRVRVLRSDRNYGKGHAVRTGIRDARGELVVFTDADGSYGPEEADRVVAALAVAPVAIGARRRTRAGAGPLPRRLAGWVFNLAMRLLLPVDFRDTQCGLKGFRREAAAAIFRRATVDGYAFDVEVLLLARRLGLRVEQVQVRLTRHDGSRVRVAADARRMLADVWAVRRAAARGAYDEAPVRDPAG